MLPLLSGEFGVVYDPELTFAKSGNARLRLRVVAKDRTRDANGQWTDGKAWFGDVIVWGKTAEHLFESIAKGDSIVIANAKAEQFEGKDKEGNDVTRDSFVADCIGVSVRWGIAKTQRAAESNVPAAIDSLGATAIQADAAPF